MNRYPLEFHRFIVFLTFFNLCLNFFSTNSSTSHVINIPKNLMHVFHLTPNGSLSQFGLPRCFSVRYSFNPQKNVLNCGSVREVHSKVRSKLKID